MKKLLIVLLALAGTYTVFAKGPFQKVVVSDASNQQIEITHPLLLEGLSMGGLMDLGKGPIDPPEEIGESFILLRYFADQQGSYKAFDRVHYYPDLSGGAGYVFYDGLAVEGGWSEFDGNWYQATEDGAEAMRAVIAAYSGDPATAPAGVASRWRWNCSSAQPERRC